MYKSFRIKNHYQKLEVRVVIRTGALDEDCAGARTHHVVYTFYRHTTTSTRAIRSALDETLSAAPVQGLSLT